MLLKSDRLVLCPIVQHEPPERGIARGNRGVSVMKKLLLVGTAFTALFGGSALAADLRRPAYTRPAASSL